MASRIPKRSSMTPTPAQTPVSQHSSSSTGRPQSPWSPTRLHRQQEKAELQNLNDRLATYIDHVRRLETENSKLSTEIRSYEETTTKEITSVKSMYEKELQEAKRLLDEVSKEKTRMEIDMNRMWEERDELKTKFDKKSKDCAVAEKNASSFESRYNELSLKYNQAQADKKKVTDELKELEKEADRLQKLADEQRRKLNEELLSRVDLENQIQSVKEEMHLKEQVHSQVLQEIKSRRQVEITEIDDRLAEQYNDQLKQSLQELRDQYEAQIRSNRADIDKLYQSKMDDYLLRSTGAADELRKYKSQMEIVSSKLAGLESAKASLMNRIHELEGLLESERNRHKLEMDAVEADAQRMRMELAAQLAEQQELIETKIALDVELAAYKKLLEAEEARCNLTPPAGASTSIHVGGYTPVRARGGKRKRTEMEESEESIMHEFDTKTSAKGDIHIIEACSQGRYIKLQNKGKEEMSLGSWQLARRAGTQENTFKFHRTVKIAPGAVVTVWSSDQGQTHDPPSNIVMKNQKWFVADTMATMLKNNEGEEMAVLEQQKIQLASAASRLRRGEELMFQQVGSPLISSDSE